MNNSIAANVSTVSNTTIVIPGRPAQTINGMVLSKEDIVGSFAGDIDLGSMTCITTTEGDSKVFSFANRTGTKGAGDTNNIAGDVNITIGELKMNTTIVIPGRPAQTIEGMALSKADIIGSFAGDIDLGSMACTETTEGDTKVVSFANRTGTKGAVDLEGVLNQALNIVRSNREEEEPEEEEYDEDGYDEYEDEDEDECEVVNTTIVIPGRPAQTINGMVLLKGSIISSFEGDIDLGSMACTETTEGDTKIVSFSNRTGTKG